jgi:hypothetical protein
MRFAKDRVRQLKKAVRRAEGRANNDNLTPLRKALAAGPDCAWNLARRLRLNYRSVCVCLRQYPRYFRRLNPDAKPTKRERAMYALVPDGERPAAAVCRHCKDRHVNRPRGLCWPCYYEPGVKELYPPTSPYARRGIGHGNGTQPLPMTPTNAPVGSLAKLKVMYARLQRGEQLFHPNDSRDQEPNLLLPFAGKVYQGGADNGLTDERPEPAEAA